MRNSDCSARAIRFGHEGIRQIVSLVDVEIGDRAIERGETLGHLDADAPHADDADFLAMNPGDEMHVGVAPASIPDIPVRLGDLAGHGEEQPNTDVGHVSSQDVGRVGDPDPICLGV